MKLSAAHHRRMLAAAALAAMVGALLGCGDDGGSSERRTPPPATTATGTTPTVKQPARSARSRKRARERDDGSPAKGAPAESGVAKPPKRDKRGAAPVIKTPRPDEQRLAARATYTISKQICRSKLLAPYFRRQRPERVAREHVAGLPPAQRDAAYDGCLAGIREGPPELSPKDKRKAPREAG
jgi:hypothetical protein